MEISCVVPAFENPALLRTCLTSIARQRNVGLEIIITDDSPGPTVRDLIVGEESAAHDIRYLAGARTGNPVDNWNRGLAAARAPLCVVVHHDEYLIDPLYLRRAADAMRRPEVVAVIAPTRVAGVVRPSRFKQARRLARAIGRPAWILPSLNWIGPTAAFVFRRGPMFNPGLVQLTDVDFYRRVLAGGRAAFLNGDCVGSLGHHPAQISARIDPFARAGEELSQLAQGMELWLHRRFLRLRVAFG